MGPDLEQLEYGATFRGHHIKKHIKIRAICRLAVGCTQCKRHEVQHGGYHERT